jgi:hypothetical protein
MGNAVDATIAVIAAVASVLAAVVGAVATVWAASITARGRMPAPANGVALPSPQKKLGIVGWTLVGLLYLSALFCFVQSLSELWLVMNWGIFEAAYHHRLENRSDVAWTSAFWGTSSFALIVIGYLAQRNLRGRL